MSENKENPPFFPQALHIEDESNNRTQSQSKEYSKHKRQSYRSFDQGNGVQQWKRFWVIRAKDEKVKLAKADPFVIDLALKGMVGNYKLVKPLPSGHLLIEVDCLSHANNLAKTTRLHTFDVDISPHFTLNFSKAIIYCDHLDRLELDDVKEGLKSQGVCDVHRIVPRNNDGTKSNLYILTFDSPEPPQSIKVGYLRVKTKLYVPSPRLCYKCQKFGHGKNSCHGQLTCAKCGLKDHSKENCDLEACCPNCNGDHSAESKHCPKYKEQKEILKIQFSNNITFFEAKKRYDNQNTPLQKAVTTGEAQSFSSAVASNPVIQKKDQDINKLTQENNVMKTEIASLREEIAKLKSMVASSNEANNKKRSLSDRDDYHPSSEGHLSKQKPRLEGSYGGSASVGAESSASMEVEPCAVDSSRNTAPTELGMSVSVETDRSPSQEDDGYTKVPKQRHRRSTGRRNSSGSGGEQGRRSASRSPVLTPKKDRPKEHSSRLPVKQKNRERQNRSRSPKGKSKYTTITPP